MTPVKKIGIIGGVAAVFAAAVAVVTHSSSTPLARIDVNTSCVQAMSTQPQLVVYSGSFALTVWQWGFEAVNVLSGAEHHANGVGFNEPKTCPMGIYIDCTIKDCHQSVSSLAASPTTPNWLVAKGAPNMCCMDGLQVWKFNASTQRFNWYGFIDNHVYHCDRTGPRPLLDGDFAYAVENALVTPQLWSKYDLNTKTVVAHGLVFPTNTPPAQADVQGYTYTIHAIFPSPLPQPWLGPSLFYWLRAGGGSTTPTPAPITAIPPTVTAPPVCPTCAAVATCVPVATPTRTKTPHFGPVPTKVSEWTSPDRAHGHEVRVGVLAPNGRP